MATLNVVYWAWLPTLGRLMAQADWLGPKVGSHLALFLHSSREPGELSQSSKHKDYPGYYYYNRACKRK